LYNRYWFGSVLHRFSITGTENRTKSDRFSLVRFGYLSEPKILVFFRFGLIWIIGFIGFVRSTYTPRHQVIILFSLFYFSYVPNEISCMFLSYFSHFCFSHFCFSLQHFSRTKHTLRFLFPNWNFGGWKRIFPHLKWAKLGPYKAQLDSTISYPIKQQFTSASLITLKNHFEESKTKTKRV
jgi:hypothetical protein